MDYSIREENGRFTLLRHGKPVERDAGIPNNCELEFWTHLQAYKKAYEALTRVQWMAENYADGDRFDGENYAEAVEDIKSALEGVGITPPRS